MRQNSTLCTRPIDNETKQKTLTTVIPPFLTYKNVPVSVSVLISKPDVYRTIEGFLTAMSMSPETQNMKLKRNMVYLTQEEMYVNPLGIRRLILVGLSKCDTGSCSNFAMAKYRFVSTTCTAKYGFQNQDHFFMPSISFCG
jgi:hypothetical protein